MLYIDCAIHINAGVKHFLCVLVPLVMAGA